MANTQDSFSIDVNINNSTPRKPTTPQIKKLNPTSPSSLLKYLGIKNSAILGTATGGIISVGKTYIDLQFSKTENSNKANRFNLALKFIGYTGAIAGAASVGGPVAGGVAAFVAGATITNDILSYSTKLYKKQIRFDYINIKYKQNTANGSRWPGGSL